MNKLVVLDWDNTLAFADRVTETPSVKAAGDAGAPPADLPSYRPVGQLGIGINGQHGQFNLYIRPGAHDLIEHIAQTYGKPILWSFSVPAYLDQCMKVSKMRKLFGAMISRGDDQPFIKDLMALVKAGLASDLTQIVALDDSSYVFGAMNPFNFIRVPYWDIHRITDDHDTELQLMRELIAFRFRWLENNAETVLRSDEYIRSALIPPSEMRPQPPKQIRNEKDDAVI